MDKSKTVSPSVAWAIIALAVLGFLALFYYVSGSFNFSDLDNTPQSTNTPTNTSSPQPATGWDYESEYQQVQNGMSKADVEALISIDSISCTESQDQYVGKIEICYYGNIYLDDASISISYTNDIVSSKTKTSN